VHPPPAAALSTTIKKSAGSQFSGTSTVYAGETNALAGVAPGLPLTLQKEVV
jgi:hypothetical protein